MKYYNNRGMSLIGMMVAAAIGLIVVLGLSKTLMNFSEQTVKVSRMSDISIIKQNISAKLRDVDTWKASIAKSKGKIPGRDVPVVLYDVGRSNPWLCQRKGGSITEGVVIIDHNGTPQEVSSCNKCTKSENCGFDKAKFSRIELEVIPNDELRPSYKGDIFDTSGGKTKTEISTESANEELYDEKQVTCPDGQFLVMVEKGEPICRDYDEGVKNKVCGPNEALVGFDNDGEKLCRDIRAYTNVLAPTIAQNRGGCSRDQYMRGFDNRGNRICINRGGCPNGQYLQGFDNNGRAICRRINFLGMGGNCGSNKVAYGVDSFGKPRCKSLTVRKSHYSYSCDKCKRSRALGSHFFCSLASFGSGGWNSNCDVKPSGNGWTFSITDHDSNDQTTRCDAVCIDFNF